ncbi:beta-ketoacyl-[acyl-carrier-protein] synthase family protein [Fulvimonas sp. R45]|uniref:beta-ketoacyl-[acyl-carrier-protein] synthase family protein n=1 Tax=Fulvimonas sp. R45 TaxID=3045937 RepID=UPI00265DFFE9|nr:beta-ketoacyl-[acyl-carrier-protein] synthase family protein [Fulvimonas sp. R45]MDO1528786.1 beta-ketoacyl-[acyl-carrier-protein] synthase family protein [Fulvimonas sp. R45]
MPTVTTRRVAITGMGAVSPFGVGAGALWQGLRQGRCAIGPLRHRDSERLRVKIAAQVPESFDPASGIDERTLPLLDRTSEFALHAAREAIAQCGLDFARDDLGLRTAVVVGTGVGGELTQDEQSRRLYAENSNRTHPFTIVRLMTNASASHISIAHGLRGPAYAVASACASANHAIIQAAQMIRYGLADVAITGGTEACLSYGALRAWESMRVLSDDTCRPFSANRRGLVLGEGAGIFVLESLEHARARGADILAELAGSGMSADASDIVMPSADGAASAMRQALADAGLAPEDVDYVNAHGTGTQANDATETRAIRLAFGAHADRLAVSSTKSMHGHALGASGALELVAAIGALRDGVVPPTANLDQVDPACDLDYVPNVARGMPVRAVLSNSFAFGGLNAVLALKRAP